MGLYKNLRISVVEMQGFGGGGGLPPFGIKVIFRVFVQPHVIHDLDSTTTIEKESFKFTENQYSM